MKKPTKNQERIWKQIDVIFLAQHRVHEFSFAQSSFPKYRRHQKVTGDIPLSVGTRLKIFYLILLHNNSQIHIPVMITNHRFARPLFTCLDWLPIMTSPSFWVAKVYLYHHPSMIRWIEVIYWNGGNILSILFLASQYLKNTDRYFWGELKFQFLTICLYIELYNKNVLLNIINWYI